MMDHHCQWIGNCVGFFNFKVYIHLLVNSFLNSLCSIVVSLQSYHLLFSNQTYHFLFTISFFPAVYVLFESGRLLNDCWQSLRENQTLIESFKHVKGPRLDLRLNLIRHFGSQAVFDWLLPRFVLKIQFELREKMIGLSAQIKQYTFADEYLFGKDDDDKVYDDKDDDDVKDDDDKLS